MDNSFQTSFIPKKPIDTSVHPIRTEKKHHKSPFSVLATILFVITLIISGGLYFYKTTLEDARGNLISNIEKVKNSFNQSTIQELELFSKRISSSKEILNKHIMMSPMFELLGDLTIPAIQYTSFYHEDKDGEFLVTISGISYDYHSIALQANVFDEDRNQPFKNVVFSNLNTNQDNYVTFDLSFTVDPRILSYENNLGQSSLSNTQ